MDTLNAHGLLAQRTDRDILPCSFLCQTARESLDAWPAVAVGLAVLSGWLPGCETDDDLDDAVRHGMALWNSGIVSDDDLHREAINVIEAVLQWGNKYLTGSER